MVTIYLKEAQKEEIFRQSSMPKCIQKIIWFMIKKTNWILLKKIEENKKIYFIPNIEQKVTYQKIRKKLEKEKTQTQKVQLVLANTIKPYASYFQGYKIIIGRSIYLLCLESIIEKILQEEPLALQDVYLLTNSYREQNVRIIKKLAPKVKTMNIITQEIEKYKVLEEMMQEQGIILSVANNKKKSLKKAKIIINLDFSEKQLMEYSIFRHSIIINATQEKMTNLKGWNGIIIQTIQIVLEEKLEQWIKENELQEEFTQLEVYESRQEGKIDENKIKIIDLYGNHGKIDEKELRNWQKILTN